jgi:cellulose biosynthesis protein BcsQ
MKRILIASSKGGAGKSTTALLLTVALRRAGHKVRVEDKDPQGTLTRGLEKNGGNEDPKATYTIIDVAPRHEHLEGEIANASLTLVPLAPTMSDIWATLDWTAKMKDRKGDIRLLWNRMRQGVGIHTEDKLEEFRAKIKLPAMKTRLQLRASYDVPLSLGGWKALNTPAKEEALTLVCEVRDILG